MYIKYIIIFLYAFSKYLELFSLSVISSPPKQPVLVHMLQVRVYQKLITRCAENRCKPNEHFHLPGWQRVGGLRLSERASERDGERVKE